MVSKKERSPWRLKSRLFQQALAGIANRVEVAPGQFKIDKRDERGGRLTFSAAAIRSARYWSKGGVAPRPHKPPCGIRRST